MDKSANHDGCRGSESLPHQGRPRYMGMRLCVLDDVAVFSPVVDECKLEDCHVDTVKRQDVFMG